MTPTTPPAIAVCDRCDVRTLAGALRMARAGATIAVRDQQRGNFVVRVPGVTIAGPAILDGAGRGTVLTIDAPGVTVRDLTIRNGGADFVGMDAGVRSNARNTTLDRLQVSDTLFGIYLARANRSVIEDSRIEGRSWLAVPVRGDAIRVWYSQGTRITGNRVEDARDDLIWFSDDTVFRRNTVSGGRYGVHLMYSNHVTIGSNAIDGCEVGSYGMYSRYWVIENNLFSNNRGSTGYGVGLKAVDDAVVRGNAFVSNHSGAYIDNSPSLTGSKVRLEGNVFAYNEVGVESLPSEQNVTFTGNAFVDNYRQVAVLGGGSLGGVAWTPGGRGNYWSDYAGYDRSGDGVGDMPYRERSLYGSLADMNPRLDLLAYSPAASALDFAGRALPLFTPPVLVDDTAPSMRPTYPSAVPRIGRAGSSGPLAAVGFFTLAASFGVLVRMRPRIRSDRRRAERAEASTAIEVRVIRKRYGKATALEDVAFDVAGGEAIVLWGPNGSGKTTLIRCMLGIVEFEGEVVRHGAFGYVPQQLPAFDMRARDLATFAGALRGFTKRSCDEALRLAGLWEAQDRSVAELSGGQRQRLSVAIASLGAPDILFLDEPTVGLDLESKRTILQHLRKAKERGTAIVIATHIPGDVLEIADRVAIMSDGRVRAIVPKSEFAQMMERQREDAS